MARPPKSGRNLICLYCPMSARSPIHSMSRTDCEEQCLHPANVNFGAAAGPGGTGRSDDGHFRPSTNARHGYSQPDEEIAVMA